MEHITEDAPIKWVGKIGRLLESINRQITYASHRKTIYLYPKDYASLLDAIPETKRHLYADEIKYRGYSIRKYPGAKI